jgi:hypothetical protein
MDKTIKHIDGNIGGYLVGRRHSEGGIKAINKSTNQPLEMEGGEVVITRNAVSDGKKREFEGEMLTNKEILSKINAGGGGVSFEEGGEIHAYGNKYNYGGHLMSDHEILHTMAVGGQIDELDDFDFENEEYALGGTIGSWNELEGASVVQSGFNYPTSRIINYNSFPIYLFPEYKNKKSKKVENPYKFDANDDGSISVYIFKQVGNIFTYEEIHKLENITFLYDYIESLKYYQSDCIIVTDYDFDSVYTIKPKSRLYRRRINLENEYSFFVRGIKKNRRGLNLAIEELDNWINHCNWKIDPASLYSKTIKRVYYTQTINYKDRYTKTGKTFPSTSFETYGEKDYFIIMHNPNQIIDTMKNVNLQGVKYNLNYLYIEFEDGAIWFNQMAFLPNYKNASKIEELFEVTKYTTDRDSATINILTSCAYQNNNLSPNFVLDDSQKAFEQIDSLNKGGVTQPTPQAQPTPTPQNTQSTQQKPTFKVGDDVKYIGRDLLSIKNGDIGKIINIPNKDQYDVEFPNGSSVYIDEIDLILTPNFKVGDRVEYLTVNGKNIKKGTIGVVTRIGNYSVVDVDFDLGNNQIKNYSVADGELRLIEFKVGDNVKYIGADMFGIPKGTIGNIIKDLKNKVYEVRFNGTSSYINQNELELISVNTNLVNDNSIQKFQVGDEVIKFSESPNEIFIVTSCDEIFNEWIYKIENISKGTGFVGQKNDTIVFADESSRYDNEFNIGDKVRVVYPNKDFFGNVGTITKAITAPSQISSSNPSGKIYSVKYELYGTNANGNEIQGQWEGKDLILLESTSTQTATTPSTQSIQTPLTPMTPSTNAGARVKLTMIEQELEKQINSLTDLLNLIPEYDFEDRIAISQELTTLQEQMNVYVAQSIINNDFVQTGKIKYEQDVIDLMLRADCVKLSPRPTNTNPYQNGFNPNGKQTALNKFNYDLIHTEQFQKWFGNYGLAYNYSKIGESNLGLSSQVVNSDGEPIVVYMGVGREFEKITFNRFPIGYFAVNEAYAEWFATTKADDGVGYVLPFFLNIRRPLDLSMFGIDDVTPKDFFDWLYLETGMTGKELGFDDRWFLPNQPALKVWMYIRNCPNFLNKLKEYKICDGIHFYENNPSNPVNANNYMTEVWTIFYSNQCKLASQDRSEMILSANNSFLMKKGGLVK